MDSTYFEVLTNMLAAVAAGGMIGLERSYFARPAGFRTHALVCLASCLLMSYSSHLWALVQGAPIDAIKADPTRMAQGIMTGIGFLGAGVIFKEGLNVRGLTTAASIWITAAIGVLLGVGYYAPAATAVIFTLIILALFPWIESKLPSRLYCHHFIRFDRNASMSEAEVRAMLTAHDFKVLGISYRATEDGLFYEFKMLVRTSEPEHVAKLAEDLRKMSNVITFDITPTGD